MNGNEFLVVPCTQQFQVPVGTNGSISTKPAKYTEGISNYVQMPVLHPIVPNPEAKLLSTVGCDQCPEPTENMNPSLDPGVETCVFSMGLSHTYFLRGQIDPGVYLTSEEILVYLTSEEIRVCTMNCIRKFSYC